MNKTERIRQGGSPIIGYNIRRLREQKRLRNMDLVAKLQLEGIPSSTSSLSKIEQGGLQPYRRTAGCPPGNIGVRLQRLLQSLLRPSPALVFQSPRLSCNCIFFLCR